MSQTLSDKNKFIIACAGSGKTTYIVERALKIEKSKVLIVTYTNENLDQIKSYFIKNNGCIPPNIFIQSWFTFLLQEGIRPYQNQLIKQKRVKSIYFQTGAPLFHKKGDYLTKLNDIYSNKASEFICDCNNKTKGLIFKRLEKIYEYIFIDELQDLSGYDLELLGMLLKSKINIMAVGDPRQTTFTTNHSRKNKKYKGSGIYSWLKEREDKKELEIIEKNESHRCNQAICDFADSLFPDFPKTISKNSIITGHDGVLTVLVKDVAEYVKQYTPIRLRYSKTTNTLGLTAINIGSIKGRTYDRVIVFPTKPMVEFLKTKNIEKAGDRSKFYVAVTRARYSVTFVI
jgi:superfamily I DNA/RNA helicase